MKRSEKYKRLCELDGKGKHRKELDKLKDYFSEDLVFFFGDVHSGSFDGWWSETEKTLEKNTVENYVPIFVDEVEAFVEEWSKRVQSGKAKSLREEMDYFFEDKWLGKRHVWLMITLGDPSNIDATLEEIKTRLEDRRKELVKSDDFGEFFPRRLYPTQPIRFKELQDYLEVYDLKNKYKNWRKVAETKYPGRGFTENFKRWLQMEYEKAKEIIINAEHGVFPGRY